MNVYIYMLFDVRLYTYHMITKYKCILFALYNALLWSVFLDFSADSVDKSHTKHTNKASNLHLEIQFTDNTTRFYCRIYYAEQFRKLRSIIFSEGEERYIRSLCHCVQWIARGGKSGSMFCKTHGKSIFSDKVLFLSLQTFLHSSLLEDWQKTIVNKKE